MSYHDFPGGESGPQNEHPNAEDLTDSRPQRRRGGAHNLIIAAAILALVCSALLRTYHSSTTESSRIISQLTSEIDDAMQATKTAYALQSRALVSNRSHSITESSRESRTQRDAEDDAISKWRKLAAPNHPVSTRRLGLSLLMFGRKGGLDVLLSVGGEQGQMVGRLGDGGTGRRRIGDVGQASIAPNEEEVVWRSLYGSKPISIRDVPDLKSKIDKMNLGWFSNIAIEQLYSRAGMAREAHAAHVEAYTSASRMAAVDAIEMLLFLVGILMWIAIAIRSVAQYAMTGRGGEGGRGGEIDAHSVPTPNTQHLTPDAQYGRTGRREDGEMGGGIDAHSVPTPNAKRLTPDAQYDLTGRREDGGTGREIDARSVPTPNTQHPTPNTEHRTPVFSYRARTTAFAVFLASYLFIGYPLRALLPDTHHWSDTAVMRLSSGLQITLYIPIVLVALYALRWIYISEIQPANRPGLRQILAALGVRSARPLADIAGGVQGYILVTPLFLFAGLFSSLLFRSVHTPINPVQLQALGAVGPFDQLLILIETAVAAPIVEELMFRGLLFPALSSRWGYVGGVVLTSAVFGLLHPNLPAGFLPLWTLGAAFAVVFQRRKSLLPCIVMHSLHNGFVTIMMFMVFAK